MAERDLAFALLGASGLGWPREGKGGIGDDDDLVGLRQHVEHAGCDRLLMAKAG